MSNCIITGGAGFIGSHLAERLLQNGHNVTIVDDFSAEGGNYLSNITHNENRLKVITSDFYDVPNYRKELGEADYIFHLAGPVGVMRILDEGEKAHSVVERHLAGIDRMLHHVDSLTQAVFLASSSEIYGNTLRMKDGIERSQGLSESDQPDLPEEHHRRWWYAHMKRESERRFISFASKTKIPVFIGRLFNITGGRQKPDSGMVIPRFIEQSLKGGALTIYGNGEQVRSFCSVDDCVAAIEYLAFKVAKISVPEQIFNIGYRQPVRIKELARRINAKTGNHTKPLFKNLSDVYGSSDSEVDVRIPNTQRLHRYGFKPSIPLDQILEDMIDLYQSSGRSNSLTG